MPTPPHARHSNTECQVFGDIYTSDLCASMQGFVRSTTKYWVRTTDVSAVKNHVLQHLPVFQFEKTVG
jgi:SPX domain protein involved in polyphosphate accumulation